MNSQFHHIGIVTRARTPNISTTLSTLVQFLHQEDIQVYLDTEIFEDDVAESDFVGCHFIHKDLMGRHCDLVLVLGGDGTLLSVARKLASGGVPVIGINHGHLGFLTQVPRDNIIDSISSMLSGKYVPEERTLLEAAVLREQKEIECMLALNDVVLSRGEMGQMIEFEVFIDNEFVYRQRSDGLIISTPTGSTAYALAAGGPILQPTLRALSLVPICPQSMTNRPIAISDNKEINVVITKSHDARLYFDGQSYISVQTADHIHICRHLHHVRLLLPTDYQYYKTLRQKLHWGEQLV